MLCFLIILFYNSVPLLYRLQCTGTLTFMTSALCCSFPVYYSEETQTEPEAMFHTMDLVLWQYTVVNRDSVTKIVQDWVPHPTWLKYKQLIGCSDRVEAQL